ncbi:MAG TPA: SDR family NAD(P)-dependent oxidoreductase, partial [Pirellulales bacterium]|nr:SDR family NAD(P)-dependent oxidoreductase [Pirellulales bacterium]
MTSTLQPGEDRSVALITGSGAPRIGNCVARTLAAAGYRVVLHAHRSRVEAAATAAELEAQGTPAAVVSCDLADEKELIAMVADATAAFGRIDALVNCAAVWLSKPLEEVEADDVRRHFEINTLATFLCCRHVGLQMAAQESGGAIVNLGDWATVRPYLNYAAYFPSKGAIPTLTRDFAVELASRNPRVRVNAVLPGPAMLPEGLSDQERKAAIGAT